MKKIENSYFLPKVEKDIKEVPNKKYIYGLPFNPVSLELFSAVRSVKQNIKNEVIFSFKPCLIYSDQFQLQITLEEIINSHKEVKKNKLLINLDGPEDVS